jgi:serine/threonine protein kinase
MLTEEANILSSMNHPKIVKLIEVHENDTWFMIEMEYLKGGTLRQYLYNTEITDKDASIILK